MLKNAVTHYKNYCLNRTFPNSLNLRFNLETDILYWSKQ